MIIIEMRLVLDEAALPEDFRTEEAARAYVAETLYEQGHAGVIGAVPLVNGGFGQCQPGHRRVVTPSGQPMWAVRVASRRCPVDRDPRGRRLRPRPRRARRTLLVAAVRTGPGYARRSHGTVEAGRARAHPNALWPAATVTQHEYSYTYTSQGYAYEQATIRISQSGRCSMRSSSQTSLARRK